MDLFRTLVFASGESGISLQTNALLALRDKAFLNVLDAGRQQSPALALSRLFLCCFLFPCKPIIKQEF